MANRATWCPQGICCQGSRRGVGRAQWQVRGRPEWLLSLPGGSRGAHGLPAGVMGSGEALGLARRARGRGESPAGGGAGWVRALGLPGGKGVPMGTAWAGGKAWPASPSGAVDLRVVTGPAALPSRLGPHPHPAESESQPPGFNPPSGGFHDSSWIARGGVTCFCAAVLGPQPLIGWV